MSQWLLRFGLLAMLSGSSYSAPSDDIPVDIFRFNVHGAGAELVLSLVEKYGLRAQLHCNRDRTVIFGTQKSMKMPGVDCATSNGEFVLRAEAYEDPATHALMYTFKQTDDPRVKATIEKVIDALTAAVKDAAEVDDVERTCCRSLNGHMNPTIVS